MGFWGLSRVPQPDVRGGVWEMGDQPHTPSEIMGRGPQARKSKSFFKSSEESTVLALIDAYPDMLLKLFRELHAKTFTETVVRERDGSKVEVVVPEVLTDDELREEYPYIHVWERMHQEQVEHRPSVDGFSIKQAVQGREEERLRGREESSAGSERPGANGAQVTGDARGRWR